VAQSGWCRSRSHTARSGLHGARPGVSARARDAAFSDAASRYRHCQASHWRACLLQH
jgi:hypothetical protein